MAKRTKLGLSSIPELPAQADFWKHWPEDVQAWLREKMGIDVWSEFADTDWTLIVKLHAMIETALNSAILSRLDTPELGQIIARLDTSNMATGKVAFAKALKILDNDCSAFLQQLSELRNFCVHDIRNFDFNLNKYVSTEVEDKRAENKRRALVKLLNKQVPLDEQYPPQTKLKVGAITVLENLFINDVRCEIRRNTDEIKTLKAEHYDKLYPPTPKVEWHNIPVLARLRSLGFQFPTQNAHQE